MSLTSKSTDWIDASVAPPSTTHRQPGAKRASRRGRSNDTQSPPNITSRKLATSRAAGGDDSATVSSISRSTGTVFQTVIGVSVISCIHASGSARRASSGRTMVPPTLSNPKMSTTDRSNFNADTASTASLEPTPYRSLRSSMVLLAPRWVISTPFGVPVEPEVNST